MIDLYILTMRAWLGHCFKTPHRVLHRSLVSLLLALPVVTGGYGVCLTLQMGRGALDEDKFRTMDLVRRSRPWAIKAVAMGIMDLLLAVLGVLCLGLMTKSDTPMVMRAVYSVYFLAQLVLGLSALYRYPILSCNPELPLGDVMRRAVVTTLRYLPACVLSALALLTALVLCALTGAGLFMLFPGLATTQMMLLYRHTLAWETGTPIAITQEDPTPRSKHKLFSLMK